MERRGRRNTVIFAGGETIRKIGTVAEISRPNRLMVETWALRLARSRSVYVPRVLSYLRDHDGREVLTLERVAGRCLADIADEAVLARCMFGVGQQLSCLRDIGSRFGWIDAVTGFGTRDNWSDFFISHVETYIRRLVRYGLLMPGLAEGFMQFLRNTDLSLSRASLVHRDLKPGNLLLDDCMRVAIVDWENAFLGDSAYDVAIFGVREGHGAPWQELARGLHVDTTSRRYLLYEIAARVGITDFHRRYETDAEIKARQLQLAITEIF